MRVRLNKEVAAGALFLALGGAALYWSTRYQFGAALNMGPGYVPTIVSCLLMGLGAIVLFRGLASGGEAIGRWHLRPLILVLAAIGVFAALIEDAGLPLAAMSIVLISAIAGHEFRWRETIILGLALAIATTLLFVHALGLGMSTFPRW